VRRGLLQRVIVAGAIELMRGGVELAELDQRPRELRPGRGQEVPPSSALGGDRLLCVGDRVGEHPAVVVAEVQPVHGRREADHRSTSSRVG
jgi:hypothetical protein